MFSGGFFLCHYLSIWPGRPWTPYCRSKSCFLVFCWVPFCIDPMRPPLNIVMGIGLYGRAWILLDFKWLFCDSLGSIWINQHRLKCFFMGSRQFVWICTFFDGLARVCMILSVWVDWCILNGFAWIGIAFSGLTQFWIDWHDWHWWAIDYMDQRRFEWICMNWRWFELAWVRMVCPVSVP